MTTRQTTTPPLQPLGRICDLLDSTSLIEPSSDPAFVDLACPEDLTALLSLCELDHCDRENDQSVENPSVGNSVAKSVEVLEASRYYRRPARTVATVPIVGGPAPSETKTKVKATATTTANTVGRGVFAGPGAKQVSDEQYTYPHLTLLPQPIPLQPKPPQLKPTQPHPGQPLATHRTTPHSSPPPPTPPHGTPGRSAALTVHRRPPLYNGRRHERGQHTRHDLPRPRDLLDQAPPRAFQGQGMRGSEGVARGGDTCEGGRGDEIV